MNDSNLHIDYEILSKYLAGEASIDDQLMVHRWLAASEENQKQFEKFQFLWEKASTIAETTPADVDTDKGWETLRSRINQNTQQPNQVIRKLQNNRFRYAKAMAAAILLTLVAYFVYDTVRIRSLEPDKSMLVANVKQEKTNLPDSSAVTLNSYSILQYADFGDTDGRKVSLKGEAFFEVLPDPARPFHVQAEGFSVTVLGTSFYVQTYDSLQFGEAGVEHGRILLVTNDGKDSLILQTGQKAYYDKSSGKLSMAMDLEVNRIAWKSGTLIFRNSPLSEVFETLESHFNVVIKCTNPDILNCHLSAKFQFESIDQVLSQIEASFEIEIVNIDGEYRVAGKGC
ncbi:MAG: FecR family protein [Cyclobacteriaceae bacterium]